MTIADMAQRGEGVAPEQEALFFLVARQAQGLRRRGQASRREHGTRSALVLPSRRPSRRHLDATFGAALNVLLEIFQTPSISSRFM